MAIVGTLRQTNIAMEKIMHLKMYFLLEQVNFHCYVSLLEGIYVIFCLARRMGRKDGKNDD